MTLTHRNCYINAYNLIAHLRVAHDDVELWTLPMFHCNGWGCVYAVTGMGGTHVVLRTIDAAEIFRLIEREGVSFACMAPTVMQRVLDYPDRGKHDSRGHVRITVAGAPPPAAFIERLENELGWEFMQIYGLTETAPLLTISIPDDSIPKDDYARRSRAGVPSIGVELQVLDDDGRPCPKDDQTVGEIGVPHKRWGETPKALVVKREGQDTSEKELIAFCRKHIAHFKCPSSVDFVPSLSS